MGGNFSQHPTQRWPSNIQLAHKYTEFRSILVPLIQRDPEIAHGSLYNQMEKLVARPFNESGISTVIIIDALDECEDEESTSTILSVLGRLVSEIKKVKLFLTSRPEPRIGECFRLPLLAEVTDAFVLHEVKESQADNDVRLFFRHGFSELAGQHGLDATDRPRSSVCEWAAGLPRLCRSNDKLH